MMIIRTRMRARRTKPIKNISARIKYSKVRRFARAGSRRDDLLLAAEADRRAVGGAEHVVVAKEPEQASSKRESYDRSGSPSPRRRLSCPALFDLSKVPFCAAEAECLAARCRSQIRASSSSNTMPSKVQPKRFSNQARRRMAFAVPPKQSKCRFSSARKSI